MRNLKLINLRVSKFAECILNTCVDQDTGSLFIVKRNGIFKLENFSFIEVLPLDISSEIISTEFLFEKGSICIVTGAGEILLVDIIIKEVECVGYVADGIKCVSFSPDQELLVIITGSDNLLLMTKEFDPLSETYIHTNEFGENKPITAGWGSKDTQFQGSIGKAAAKIEKPLVQPIFSWDDTLPQISWRGDGQLFVTSTVDPLKNYRQLRIWERCGTLTCTSEDVNGLENLIDWRPSGNIIASIQRSPHQHEIVFFEKNGLRHGEFKLPFQPQEFCVKGLIWNSASTILCIWGCNLNENNETNNRWQIMLWTSSNYHWYLKQTLEFVDTSITCVAWDSVQPYLLRVATESGELLEYNWCWSTNHSVGASVNLVAVIQGCRVYVTPFCDFVIPPPMFGYALRLPNSVNHVLVGPHSRPNDLIVVSSDGRLNAFVMDNAMVESNSDECVVELGAISENACNGIKVIPKFAGILDISWDTSLQCLPLTPFHWLWFSEHKLFCVINNLEGCHLLEVVVDLQSLEGKSRKLHSFQTHVLAMHVASEKKIAIELIDGTVLSFNPENNELTDWLSMNNNALRFSQPCPTISACQINNEHHVIGLSDRNHLYLDNKIIATNCTSFSLHDHFLLLTTHTHTLRCLSLNYDLKKVLEDKTLEALEDAPRSLERGSRLVIVIPNSTKVILQMPRGNLETIHPRALILDVVCQHLDKLEFRSAFDIMKKHRINLNLMFDHNPNVFVENCERFISELDSPANINLFLLELSEEDVSRKMYSATYRGTNLPDFKPKINESATKVNEICDTVRQVLEKIDEKKYLLSILTSFVKKTIPELDLALLTIKRMKDADTNGDKTVSSEALQYLMYLVDVNRLYDVALGTYDFDLVLMVAEKSQKDPKEYLPFLNELKNLELNYQKYKIDLHLRRYKKALQHIKHCGEEHFEECLNLIKSYRLYKEALFLFPMPSEQSSIIWRAYGDYLMQKKHYEEAGVVYYRAKLFTNALEALNKVGNWQLALCVANELGYSDVQKALLAKSLAEYLKGNRQFEEAANLYEVYVKDPEESIAILIEGQLWNTALCQISKYSRPDLIETHLKPSLEEQISATNLVVSESKEEFLKYSQRLAIVREMKQKIEEYPPDENEGPDVDMYSDISSVAGFSERSISSRSGSVKTRQTSRSKQKQDKKRYTLKEGSTNEDLALVAALAELVTRIENLRDSVKSLLEILVIYGQHTEAACIQMALIELQNIIRINIPIIWPPEIAPSAVPLEMGPLATANDIALAIEKQKNYKPVISDPTMRNPPKFRNDDDWKLLLLDL